VERGADPGLSAHALELGGDHAGVVEHQAIAGPQLAGQVGDAQIACLGAVEDEQARRIARRGGAQRDPVVRKLEVEKVYVHGYVSAGAGARYCGSVAFTSPGGSALGASAGRLA
jgi:hypothetical protein